MNSSIIKAQVELFQLSFRYQDQAENLFEKLTHTFKTGTWTSILGASGCGKTTLLKLIAGLQNGSGIQSGKIHLRALGLDESLLSNPIAYMGQKDFLFPWLDVLHNACLETYLSTGKISAQQKTKALALLKQLGLADVAQARPQQLSGGMRQRVALARTLMQQKPIVLMDEPFSALDALTRYELQQLSCEMLADKTVIFITHDVQEALRVSDDILLMSGQPAHLDPCCVPKSTQPPRDIDAEFAQAQQKILAMLTQTRHGVRLHG
ncbi:MAG: ABC transporter ATP-binding protein [Vibrio sp.]